MFLLAASSKMQEKRNILRKELLRKRKPTRDDLGNSHSIQTAKDANVRRFIVQKVCFGKKAKREVGKLLLTREIRDMTRVFSQQSQQKPGIEKGLSRKYLWEPFCLMEWTLWHTQETDKVFHNFVLALTLAVCTEGDRDRTKWKRAQEFQNSSCMKWAAIASWQQTCSSKQRIMTLRAESQMQKQRPERQVP